MVCEGVNPKIMLIIGDNSKKNFCVNETRFGYLQMFYFQIQRKNKLQTYSKVKSLQTIQQKQFASSSTLFRIEKLGGVVLGDDLQFFEVDLFAFFLGAHQCADIFQVLADLERHFEVQLLLCK
jgi:hypothetical protein